MSEAYQNGFPRGLRNISKCCGYAVGSVEPQRYILQIIGVSIKKVCKKIVRYVVL